METVDDVMEELNPMPHAPQSWVNTLWEALDHARELYTDAQWDEICMAMAWNTDALGCKDPERDDDGLSHCGICNQYG
jgi:hypothetical protein